jgi:hAT family C-terminal dimerisation region
VRKLWERFRDKIPLSAVPYESEGIGKPAVQSEGNISNFQKDLRKHKFKKPRPQSRDEFDTYISGSQTMLEGDTTAIQWWSWPFQREQFPRLSQLAIEILSIPGMSDKPERVFSGSRRRVPWDRTKTSPQLLEASECAKDWTVHGILSIPL